jgi:predicted AlkP superfamily phosphohydrolase/phosphomutase
MRGHVLLILLLLAAILVGCSRSQERNVGPKVVVLGFDGADPVLLRQWMAEGHLPHLAELSRRGTFASLGTTNPPESPVAWASFATGNNPGKTGIFDFLRRDPASYLPEIGLVKVRRPKFLWGVVPLGRPEVANMRNGQPFNELASKAGVATVALRMPLEFPPTLMGTGELLAGLGVPDLRGTWGTFFYFATDLSQWESGNTEFGGRLVRLIMKDGRAPAQIDGPPNPTVEKFSRLSAGIEFVRREHGVEVTLQDKTELVKEGQWSDWLPISFPITPLNRLHGICRFFMLEASPELRVYMTPIDMDPRQPPFALSFPADFSRKLADRYGPFKTLGWQDDTWALNEGRVDEGLFLQDTFDNMNQQATMLLDVIKDPGMRLVTTVFSATDTVSHMFFRLLDKHHPAYDERLAARYGNAIQLAYERMDRLVGQVMDTMGSQATLMVVSDHGFHSWRKEFNTNTWLVQNGFLALKDVPAAQLKKLDDLASHGSFFTDVDWSRTKAYGLGLGQIYLNLKGREKYGIVNAGADAERVAREIQDGLKNYRDPETNEPVLEDVFLREAIFHGPQVSQASELQLNFYPQYRTSWQSTLGAIPVGVISANRKKWSGDHCASDPSDTPGIFLSNRRLPDASGPQITDIAPTVLALLGVARNVEMDGRDLHLIQ